jgi:hypothetical protein
MGLIEQQRHRHSTDAFCPVMSVCPLERGNPPTYSDPSRQVAMEKVI